MDLIPIADLFSDREFNWSEEAQGFASGDGFWFVTQKAGLRRIANTQPLASDFGELHAIPQFLRNEGYNHFGDPDCFNSSIFVPLEGKIVWPQGSFTIRPRLCAFDTRTMIFQGWASFPDQPTNAAWVAAYPGTGLVYSSNEHPDVIFGYQVVIDIYGLTMKTVVRTPLLDENGKQFVPGQVQGGAFTPDGKLLVLSIKAENDEIQCFDIPSGKRVKRKYMAPAGLNSENEGLMIVNHGVTPLHPHLIVYALILNNDVLESDNVSVKRYEIRTGSVPPVVTRGGTP